MLLQEVVMDSDSNQPQEIHERHSVPPTKFSRSDVAFPLVTPRKRAPSVASVVDLGVESSQPDGQTIGVVTIRGATSPSVNGGDSCREKDKEMSGAGQECSPKPHSSSLTDLPLEVQGKVLDFIFGDMHSVYAGSTSLRGKSVSSLMRHPRRKAVSDLALVSPTWREMVQERIYRHIKIKGTRAGVKDSEVFFSSHPHLRKLVRHIEFWVPVWGDKAPFHDLAVNPLLPRPAERNNGSYQLAHQANERDLIPATDLLSFSFKLCAYSATLSEIFAHINGFFPHARVFTLEGGHCKKSNMIRHFPKTLFPDPDQRLDKLPNIRTFAMRGAWNIMRNYQHWKTIEDALPNVEEWHCGYARPRVEADLTINEILTYLPPRLRHVNISLDGMYSKDTTLGSSFGTGSSNLKTHLCDHLGPVLPQLESLSFTGKICECLWTSALSALSSQPATAAPPRLKHLEIVVKACCRQRTMGTDPTTGEPLIHELGGIIADGAGITNLVFIKAFERLVLNTIEALPFFPNLEYVRIRYIDLDSPCTLLNPYWLLEKGQVYGVWNEEIVERLSELMPDLEYVELGEGIECAPTYHKRSSSSNPPSTGVGGPPPDGGLGPATPPGVILPSSLYPKWKPRSIKTSSYKIIADARGG
ncbi:hypothetical protein Z517_07123 [Fonsecaea pedrosoi CBS 271.37]|uniref:Uncharacterized protein n=1 Tax=Fonsecaea pedrosoi CBS 271.37 TaxID=1442368 RepID=A0A0D2F1Q0_9EURO|nr:uncharacterized protein Z517_07123 [Fonsecaea pedrosoi CBS 271.37]KIW80507.1 hypothetical protein Z517_07123 [Fonsecaea pedrosoi CBS 271.37]